MSYQGRATSLTPALIIYLLDISASMSRDLEGKSRIYVVTEALRAALTQMIFRSSRGTFIAPRYRIGMIGYSDEVYDILDGIKTIDQVAKIGVPLLTTRETTDTAKAFRYVADLLRQELSGMQEHPAPMVCHMTDGEFTGSDPQSVVREIMDMRVRDGNVLVENIFISDHVLLEPVTAMEDWQGVTLETQFIAGKAGKYAEKLRNISSILPETYRLMMQEYGYNLAPNSFMMFPGTSLEFVEMAFLASTATRTI